MCRIRGRAREYGLDRRVGAGGWEVVRDKATGVSGSLSMKNSINQVTGLGSFLRGEYYRLLSGQGTRADLGFCKTFMLQRGAWLNRERV